MPKTTEKEIAHTQLNCTPLTLNLPMWRAVEVVQEGGAISDIDDSSGHDYPSRVAL
jgi:hypothetical protein